MDIDDKGDVNGEFLARRLTLVRGEAREVAPYQAPKLELVVNAERKLFEAVMANDPHRAQARWHHGRILLAEHDMIPVSCDPSRQESATGDSHAQHFMLVMALAHSVASWCPSWDGLRRLSRRMVGAQESANQEHGAWFLGSWAQLRGRRSPHSCPQPLHPSPPKPGEGARDEEAEGKGDRERENLEGGRLGTPAASSSPWQSSPSF